MASTAQSNSTFCLQTLPLPQAKTASHNREDQQQKAIVSSAIEGAAYKMVDQAQHFVLHLPAESGFASTSQQSADGTSSPIAHCYLIDQQQQHHPLLIAGHSSSTPIPPSQPAMPVQLLNLSDGTAAFVPINGNAIPSSTFIQLSGDNRHLLQTPDGQTIELVPADEFHFTEEVQSADDVSSEGSSSCASSRHIHNYPTTTLLTAPEVFPPQQQVEPVYVNEKQYARILKRRAARAKLEMEGRIPKQRRKYLHESRHRHAQNRARRAGGKFDSGQPRATSSASVQGSEGGDQQQEGSNKEGSEPVDRRSRSPDR